MVSETFLAYNELDPNKKTAEWATKVVSLFRMYSRPLINSDRAIENRAVMYGTNSIDYVKNAFSDEDFIKATEFKAIPFFEGKVNAIVEEMTKTPPRAVVQAEDPLSLSAKEKDIQILKNRKILENDINSYQRAIGLGNYKMPYDKFSGNVKEFDEMGLDENDPEDVEIYKNYFQKLWYEIGAQAAVNTILKNNQFDESTLRTIVKDIFAHKACATQAYVDQITGEIKWKYVDPAQMVGIWGTSNDGKDDICRGWYKTVTLTEWLSMVGDEFDFERDWRGVLWAINFCNNKTYTGFNRGGTQFSCFNDNNFWRKCDQSRPQHEDILAWDNAYMFKVAVGYIEFKTNDATSSFVYNEAADDYRDVDFGYQLTKKEKKDGYQKKSKYQEQWRRCYYLATSTITQYIYGYQKVFFQHLEGANDEYSNGTLKYYQEQGQSAVEIGETFIRIGYFAYYRFLWLLYHVKPMKEEYVLDEVLTLAKSLKKETAQSNNPNAATEIVSYNMIEEIIKRMRKNWVSIRVFPKVDGKTFPSLPPQGRDNRDGGLDPTAIVMQQITEWVDRQIDRSIGWNPMRSGEAPPSRESLRTEQNIVASSQTATGYIYRMVQYLKEGLAISTLNYISDIVQYPDTIPYKWLEKIIGSEHFNNLRRLNKDTAHRLGIFVHDYNTVLLMRGVIEAANIALQRQQIDFSQFLFIIQSEEPKRASAKLALMKRHNEKKLRRDAIELENIKTQNALAIEKEKQRTAMIPANAQIQTAQIGAQAQVMSAQAQAQSRIEVKKNQVDSESPKQDAKTRGQKEILETENNLKQQNPVSVEE